MNVIAEKQSRARGGFSFSLSTLEFRTDLLFYYTEEIRIIDL
jgi:hypothetical protein